MQASHGREEPFRLPPDPPRRRTRRALALAVVVLPSAVTLGYYRLGPRPPRPAPPARLTVRATPEDATVLVDGARVTSPVGLTVAPGVHTVTVMRDGHETLERTLQVAGGETTEIALALEPLATAEEAGRAESRRAPPARAVSRPRPRPAAPPKPEDRVLFLDFATGELRAR